MEKLKRSITLKMFLSYDTPGEMTQCSLFFSSGLRINEVSGRASACNSFPGLSKVFFFPVGPLSVFHFSSIPVFSGRQCWNSGMPSPSFCLC